MLELKDVSFVYHSGTPAAVTALGGVSLRLGPTDRVGLIGATGSGKSTLVQHLNGILHPTTGRVLLEGRDLREPAVTRLARRRIGVAFQYPEYQFFEESVLVDVAFAPRKQGLSLTEALDKARWALTEVQLPPELWERSPFTLSGGEARRAALAGILAMEPSVLVLDEPTAGLDGPGRRRILELLDHLAAAGRGLVLVSHRLEDVAALTERVWVLGGSRLLADGPVREILSQGELLAQSGLRPPAVTRLHGLLAAQGLDPGPPWLGAAEAARAILGGWDG